MSISSFLTMVGEMGTSIVRRAGVAGDLMGGMAATSKTIGATTDDFVDVFGKIGGNNYTAGLRSSLEATNRNLDDTALKDLFESGTALDNASFNEMKMAREYFLKRQDASQYDSKASFEAVQRNIREGGNPNAGYSRAGETRAESALTRIFDTEATGMGNELKFLGASALLGGGANYMAGGEFGTGAGVGAIAATGIRGAGRLVQNSMADIETSMMKRLLGESEYGKLAPKDPVKGEAAVSAIPDVLLSNKSGKTVKDLIDEGHGGLTLSELGFNTSGKDFGGSRVDQALSLKDFLDSRSASYMKGGKGKKMVPTGEMTQSEFGALRVDDSNNFTNQSFVLTEGTPGKAAVPAQPGQSVRTQALNAIKGMSAEQVKEKGIGSSYIQKMLTDKDKGNMGANMRVMTMSGAALAGVSFTGRRNDHSSGFNKNRGNKI